MTERLNTSPDSYLYRIHFAPAHRRGEFKAMAEVRIALSVIVEAGERTMLEFHAAQCAKRLLGQDAGALRVTRMQRQERSGVWRDLRWPNPMPLRADDLKFSASGELLTNVVPTWPE